MTTYLSPSKVSWRSEGPVAVLTLDDGKANTFDRSVFHAFSAALREIAAATVGALVLTGRAGFFSAGLDLKVLPAITHAERVETIRSFGETMLELLLFGKPVVAAVSGHAMGAGAMVALASDVRLGMEGAFRFGLNEVPIGMVVPTFGMEIARASLPPTLVSEVLLHGRIFTPHELEKYAVYEKVLEPAALLPAAMRRAQALAGLPSVPYRETKARLHGPGVERARAQLAAESESLVSAFFKP